MTRFSFSLAAIIFVVGFGMTGGSGVLEDDKADLAKEAKKFQGAWTIESSVTGGTEIPGDQLKGFIVIYEGDKHTVKMGDKVIQIGTQKIDPSKSPKTIDVTMADGPNKGKAMLGIYKFDGDTMTACFDPQGKKRPTEFKSETGSENFVNVHKRAANVDGQDPKDSAKANEPGPEHANLNAFVGNFNIEWHGVLGYDRVKKQYTGVWFDNMANTTESGSGEADKTGRILSFRGEHAGNAKFLWRISNDGVKAMTIEMFQVAKDGKETLAMKVRGEKKK